MFLLLNLLWMVRHLQTFYTPGESKSFTTARLYENLKAAGVTVFTRLRAAPE